MGRKVHTRELTSSEKFPSFNEVIVAKM